MGVLLVLVRWTRAQMEPLTNAVTRELESPKPLSPANMDFFKKNERGFSVARSGSICFFLKLVA